MLNLHHGLVASCHILKICLVTWMFDFQQLWGYMAKQQKCFISIKKFWLLALDVHQCEDILCEILNHIWIIRQPCPTKFYFARLLFVFRRKTVSNCVQTAHTWIKYFKYKHKRNVFLFLQIVIYDSCITLLAIVIFPHHTALQSAVYLVD